MFLNTVPDDRSGNAETLFAKFRCCSRHGQMSTFCRVETSSAREIHRQYADVPETSGTSTLDTLKSKDCNFWATVYKTVRSMLSDLCIAANFWKWKIGIHESEAPKARGGWSLGRGYPLPSRLEGLGERRELPQRGLRRNPGRKRISCLLWLLERHSWYHCQVFLSSSQTNAIC